MRRGRCPWQLPVLVLCGLGLSVPMARAQYFGQNKVQYKAFHYEVLKTEHFDIYYYKEEQQAVERAGRMAERWYARLSKLFDHQLSSRQPIVLYACSPDFQQTNVVTETLGEGTGGVTEPFKRRVVLPFAASLAQTDHVLGHELVHAFQYDITAHEGHGATAGLPGAERLPLWFIEGMAEYFSLGPYDANTAMWMRDALRKKKFPSVQDLENPKYFPYRYGQALLAYIGGRFGDQAIVKMLRSGSASGDMKKAIKEALKVPEKTLSRDWHEALVAAYEPLRARTTAPAEYAHVVISSKSEGGDLNVGPALSPDGRRMLFLSSKDLFSIDLFQADVASGRVQRRIVNTASNPHFDSIEFVDSAGAWDPSGHRFVFAAVREGRPDLVVLDVDKGSVEREVPFRTLDQIFNPTWSPDGKHVAFSALVGGQTDLYVADLTTGRLDRMTDDEYAELQPAWSPDGRRIAFVTDRFGGQPALLAPGQYRIAFLEVASREIEPAPALEGGVNLDAQWSPDGSSLYFLADGGGVMNVYRVALASSRFFRVTNVYSGVSGITTLSPALSLAARSNRLVFSAYEDGRYDIYALEKPDLLAGVPVEPSSSTTNAALALPPTDREKEALPGLLANDKTGLEDARAFKSRPYHAHLTLDYVGQPSLVAGADRFGTYGGGSTSLAFSDMLGEHNLALALAVNGSFRDIGGAVAYTNLKHRWNWGVIAQEIPHLTGGYGSALADVGGQPSLVQQTYEFREHDTTLSGLLAYPFSKAQRIELTGGYHRISFSQQVETAAFSLADGSLIADQTVHPPAPGSVNQFELSPALVYDSAVFGATAPVAGQRYRLQLTPSLGTLSLYEALGDYRRYFEPVRPYTLAFRVVHYGRYGAGSEDPRLVPLYLGDPGLVRGYDYNSFSAGECPANASQGCPVFDRLVGSRLLVGNVELRFPLWGAISGGRHWYGPLPIDLALFSDAGVAWARGEEPSFFGGARKPVASAGAAMRVDVLGYLVAEVDFVHPFERPQKGWLWEFNFSPGF